MTEPVKHIVQEGARFHVLSWTALEGPKSDGCITTCSEPMCEINMRAINELKRCGIDPARFLPRTMARLPTPPSSSTQG